MKSLTRTVAVAVAVTLAVLGIASTGAEAAVRHSASGVNKPALVHSHWYQQKVACESGVSHLVTTSTHHGVFKPGNAHHSLLGR